VCVCARARVCVCVCVCVCVLIYIYIYNIQVQRGGLRMWTKLPERNSKLQELVAAFLLSSVGALSIHLAPQVRESLLRQARLWDSFCQGLGDPSAAAAARFSEPSAVQAAGTQVCVMCWWCG
jgi:hypothetical protein